MKMGALLIYAMTHLKQTQPNIKEKFKISISYQKIPTHYLEMTLIISF